jgi:hypothetical protein
VENIKQTDLESAIRFKPWGAQTGGIDDAAKMMVEMLKISNSIYGDLIFNEITVKVTCKMTVQEVIDMYYDHLQVSRLEYIAKMMSVRHSEG